MINHYVWRRDDDADDDDEVRTWRVSISVTLASLSCFTWLNEFSRMRARSSCHCVAVFAAASSAANRASAADFSSNVLQRQS